MSEHRWSGWPGAWCLDCGTEDQREVCLAGECGVMHPGLTLAQLLALPVTDADDWMLMSTCRNLPCSEPGSGRHDPYRKRY